MLLLPTSAEFNTILSTGMEGPLTDTDTELVALGGSMDGISAPLSTMLDDGLFTSVGAALANVLDAVAVVKSECTDLQGGIATFQVSERSAVLMPLGPAIHDGAPAVGGPVQLFTVCIRDAHRVWTSGGGTACQPVYQHDQRSR